DAGPRAAGGGGVRPRLAGPDAVQGVEVSTAVRPWGSLDAAVESCQSEGRAMPLRDHFRPPLDNFTSWDGFFGGWPAVIVQHLGKVLPAHYFPVPRVHAPDWDEYEVRVCDAKRDRSLVAAVELISPAHKDRPEHR